MRSLKHPLLLFFVGLALLFSAGMYAAAQQADAHGWHWTKCRSHDRWIRGHNVNNWYLVTWIPCDGYWAIWVNYGDIGKVWP